MMNSNPNGKSIERPLSSQYPFAFRSQWQQPENPQQPQQQQPNSFNSQPQDYYNERLPVEYQNNDPNSDINPYDSNADSRNGNGLQYKIVHLKLKMQPQNGS
jgi:hypothetical protein